jgi:hypothetical protein
MKHKLIWGVSNVNGRIEGEVKGGEIGRIEREIKTGEISGIKGRLTKMAVAFAEDQRGEGFVDVLVKMLIVVVVGAVLLAIMRTAVPDMFTDMIDKIKGVFEL